MDKKETLEILRKIFEPCSPHLFSRREAARNAVALIESQDRDLAALRQDIEAQIQIAKEACERAEAYRANSEGSCSACDFGVCSAHREQDHHTPKSAKQRYDELGCADEESDPVERLRFFCSLAFTNPQDWLDVEPFFDAIARKRER